MRQKILKWGLEIQEQNTLYIHHLGSHHLLLTVNTLKPKPFITLENHHKLMATHSHFHNKTSTNHLLPNGVMETREKLTAGTQSVLQRNIKSTFAASSPFSLMKS